MTLKQLRTQAIVHSLFRPTSLRRAMTRLGFVQADPIRSPARAQDLILRQRVLNYHAGDLEKHYPQLHLEEDFLYAYGFMTSAIWNDLHPRGDAALTSEERQVFEIVTKHKMIHPRQLGAFFGSAREVNAWGGYSKTTTRILERLQYRGLLRVAKREGGIRIYEATTTGPAHVDPDLRLGRLVQVIVGLLGPLSERSLASTLYLFARGAPSLLERHGIAAKLLKSNGLASFIVDGVRYIGLCGPIKRTRLDDSVRFLAPFDPLVWDRSRFQHLWGWAYRFEAYTPPAKRKLGYYAMPVLWRDEVLGWVNISNLQGTFRLDSGFVKEKPGSRLFDLEFEAEVERFRAFLTPG